MSGPRAPFEGRDTLPSSTPPARWELPAAVALLGLLAAAHVAATTARPLCRRVFVEWGQAFVEPQGFEAIDHVHRLRVARTWQACTDGPVDCLAQAIAASDLHHPFVSILGPAAAARLLGPAPWTALLVQLGWLLLLLVAVHATARLLHGRAAGWLAMGLALSCPALLGPTRQLHVDAAMTAWLATSLLLATWWARRGSWLAWPLLLGAASLTVLSKWEAVLATYALLGAAALLSFTGRHPLRALVGLALVPPALGAVLRRYVDLGSPSHGERAQLLGFVLDGGPAALGGELVRRLGLGPPDASVMATPPVGTLAERLLHYAGALPAAGAGLLTTGLLLAGLVLAAGRRNAWPALALLVVQGMGSVVIIALAAPDFVDDRFLQFALPAACVAAGVGLARVPRPAGLAVGAVAALVLADAGLPRSPLSGHTLLTLPPSPFWPGEGRPVALRPQAALGHGSWTRPGQCSPSEHGAVGEAYDLALSAGAGRVVLGAESRALADELWLWELVRLERGLDLPVQSLQALLRGNTSGVWGCSAVAPSWPEAAFAPGTVLVVDAAAPVRWTRETCGRFADPAEAGLEARRLGTLAGAEGDSALWLLEARE